MVFSSLFFLYFFLPLCVICYAATKRIYYRNMVLLAFSLMILMCIVQGIMWILLQDNGIKLISVSQQ